YIVLFWLAVALLAALVVGYPAFLASQAMHFFRRSPTNRRRRLELWESNLGGACGWNVELDGRPVALLTDGQLAEMFWNSYRLTPLTEDPEQRRRILTARDWWMGQWDRITYRSRAIGVPADGAYLAGYVFNSEGRVVIRSGLYIWGPGPPNSFE